MNKLVDEAPYHPGYEDAVVIERRSEPVYKGLDVRKMLWKSKPLSDEQITGIRMTTEGDLLAFARAIEKEHGIK